MFHFKLKRHSQHPSALEQNEKRQREAMQVVSSVLEQCAAALRDCAEQLDRHTEAIKSMAEVAQELRGTVREMKAISNLSEGVLRLNLYEQ